MIYLTVFYKDIKPVIYVSYKTLQWHSSFNVELLKLK